MIQSTRWTLAGWLTQWSYQNDTTHRGNYTFVSTSYALGPIPETAYEAGCAFAYDDTL